VAEAEVGPRPERQSHDTFSDRGSSDHGLTGHHSGRWVAPTLLLPTGVLPACLHDGLPATVPDSVLSARLPAALLPDSVLPSSVLSDSLLPTHRAALLSNSLPADAVRPRYRGPSVRSAGLRSANLSAAELPDADNDPVGSYAAIRGTDPRHKRQPPKAPQTAGTGSDRCSAGVVDEVIYNGVFA
jgi:hypothetical protein